MQCDAVLSCDIYVPWDKHVRCLNLLPECWILLQLARVDTHCHGRVGVSTASYTGGSGFKSGHSLTVWLRYLVCCWIRLRNVRSTINCHCNC